MRVVNAGRSIRANIDTLHDLSTEQEKIKKDIVELKSDVRRSDQRVGHIEVSLDFIKTKQHDHEREIHYLKRN